MRGQCALFLLFVVGCPPIWGQTTKSLEQRRKENLQRILEQQNSKWRDPNSLVKRIVHQNKILRIVNYILSLPESEIDIARVSFTLSKDAFPDLDLNVVGNEFEAIVANAKSFIPPDVGPEYRLRALNTLFYRKMGIEYNRDDYMGEKLPNRYVHGVIQTKKGTCANMPVFYIAVAQRLGYPVYGVRAPQHLFARYVDPELKMQNIEATNGGGWSSNEKYIEDTKINPVALKNKVYLETMTNRQLAAELIADHATFFYGRIKKDQDTAIKILERVMQIIPNSAEFWYMMGQLQQQLARKDLDPWARKAQDAKGRALRWRAAELGLGAPLREGYWKQEENKKMGREIRRPAL